MSIKPVEKSIFTAEYAIFLRFLKETRKKLGLTQKEIAIRLGQSQSFVSKSERGERRIDIVELRNFCKAFGVSFPLFVKNLDKIMEEEVGTEYRHFP